MLPDLCLKNRQSQNVVVFDPLVFVLEVFNFGLAPAVFSRAKFLVAQRLMTGKPLKTDVSSTRLKVKCNRILIKFKRLKKMA